MWGGEEETRSGTEKQCSHNLQSSHPMWWSEDNSSIFPTVNILIEARSQMAEEMIKKWKKIISCVFVFVAYFSICLLVLKFGGNLTATTLDLNQQQCA